MKITIESTSKIVEMRPSFARDPIPCRVWEGFTESGIRLHAFISRVAVLESEDTSQFDRELLETRAPSEDTLAIPMRMIL